MYEKNSCGCGRADQWQRERRAGAGQGRAAVAVRKERAAAKQEWQLSRAYVPFQVFGELFAPDEALCKGTIFRALYQPYC